MTDRKAEIERIFSEALALPKGQRAPFLDTECADDPACRQRVDDLLKAHEESEGFLEDTRGDDVIRLAEVLRQSFPSDKLPTDETLGDEMPGDRIGRYVLLERLGEGGWGVVWMAEQREPVKRRVALKILKVGMDTRKFVARFEAERQTLAMMDHPNIAHVFDGGATERGRPYFVMSTLR